MEMGNRKPGMEIENGNGNGKRKAGMEMGNGNGDPMTHALQSRRRRVGEQMRRCCGMDGMGWEWEWEWEWEWDGWVWGGGGICMVWWAYWNKQSINRSIDPLLCRLVSSLGGCVHGLQS